MSASLITAIIVLVLVLAVLLYLIVRARRNYVPPAPRPAEVAPAESAVDHQRLTEQGTELIERRVELDARRGALGGDANLLAQLDALTARRDRGEISEAEYEAEKVRLLGG